MIPRLTLKPSFNPSSSFKFSSLHLHLHLRIPPRIPPPPLPLFPHSQFHSTSFTLSPPVPGFDPQQGGISLPIPQAPQTSQDFETSSPLKRKVRPRQGGLGHWGPGGDHGNSNDKGGDGASAGGGGGRGWRERRERERGEEESADGDGGGGSGSNRWKTMLETAVQTLVGLSLVGFGGISYVAWYKYNVLRKVAIAFKGGYDPVLELDAAESSKPHPDANDEASMLVTRPEQDLINRIMHGEELGSYWLILGPKGTGKTSMIVDAMKKNMADGVAVCEAHEDLEVFRLRVGKALNYELNEDFYGGLFQRREPREGGPGLDIERAMNKLEKVAISEKKRRGKPLVMVFTNIHYLSNSDEGVAMLHLLQQRAESWAQAGVLTMVFNSDDAWPYEAMKKSAARMHVVSVQDLSRPASIKAIQRARSRASGEWVTDEYAGKLYDLIGGRLSYINQIARWRGDMVQRAEDLIKREAGWINMKLGLIPDHDDDVMDEQKYSSCSFLLFQELVKRADAQAAEEEEEGKQKEREREARKEEVDASLEEGEVDEESFADPGVEYGQAREIMTRADFFAQLDHDNMIAIDVNRVVRADSRLLLNSMRRIVYEEDFQEKLDNVRDRVDEIESLHRTAELTLKDDFFKIGMVRR